LSVPPLDAYLSVRRAEIEAALERCLSAHSSTPTVVVEAMRYSLLGGGKRLRPILTLASAEAIADLNGTPVDAACALAMPAACAVEMIHTYSLIHDDLPAMDDDVLRRGRPTLHVVYGDGLAILAGDALNTEAFALLAREPQMSDADIATRKIRAIACVAAAAGAAGMVGGQAIDLTAVSCRPNGQPAVALDAAALQDMHARKTGAMIRASAVAGAIMAGGNDVEIAAIDGYAQEIGLAFQIVDDILDIEGATSTLGKTAGKDVAAGKPTYPALFGLDGSRQLASACLQRAHRMLAGAHLSASRLGPIADWVVHRTS
jgi:geranylgeranyl pyrophosphate synthase